MRSVVRRTRFTLAVAAAAVAYAAPAFADIPTNEVPGFGGIDIYTVIGIAFFAALAIAAFLIIRAIARAARRRKTSAEGADPAVKAPDLGNEE